MSGHRHATDRTDWILLAGCPRNGEDHPLLGDAPDKEHLTIEAHATNTTKPAQEIIFGENTSCPVCEAELAIAIEERPAASVFS
jgi:hypothetical protein